jgi:hypothetical protein
MITCYCCERRHGRYQTGCDCDGDYCVTCILCDRHCSCPDKPARIASSPNVLPYGKCLENAIQAGVAATGYSDDKESVFGIAFADPTDDAPAADAAASNFLESWVQRYVKENFERFGFERIKGPFDKGPDFQALPKGGDSFVDIEVEVLCRNYIKHGHPGSAAFSKVAILIVLEDQPPTADIRPLLPPTIIHIDRAHFVTWYERANPKYEYRRPGVQPGLQMLACVNVIASEFLSRWVEICPHKERDMAICPHCDMCPYFGEPGEAEETFTNMAINFAGGRGSPDLNLAEVTRDELDAFFAKCVRKG